MSICNTCKTKGNCCKGFVLNFKVSKDNWYNESIEVLKENNIDYFIPIRPVIYYEEERIQVQFDCTRLGSDGLCKDYENRPDLCKEYQPKQDPLCCEYVHRLRGIPIIEKEYSPWKEIIKDFKVIKWSK